MLVCITLINIIYFQLAHLKCMHGQILAIVLNNYCNLHDDIILHLIGSIIGDVATYSCES